MAVYVRVKKIRTVSGEEYSDVLMNATDKTCFAGDKVIFGKQIESIEDYDDGGEQERGVIPAHPQGNNPFVKRGRSFSVEDCKRREGITWSGSSAVEE